MPEITETEVRQFITTELAGVPPIEADAHRAVENKIMDFVVQENAKNAKTKVLVLDSFSCDRNYSIATGLSVGSVIEGVLIMLVCKVVNNGFQIGDTVTAPTSALTNSPYGPNGVGVQFNNLSNNVIRIMTSDELIIMANYNPATGAISNNIAISGVDAANWSIKLIISYK